MFSFRYAPRVTVESEALLTRSEGAGLDPALLAAKLGALGGTPQPLIDAIVAGATRMASPLSQVHVHQLGGAVSRVSDDATAYSNRGAAFALNIIPAWADPGSSAAHVGWARELFEAVARHGNGSAYLNFLGDEGQERVRAAFGPRKHERLARIKRRYDPENVFRYNQNILPAA